MTDETKQAIEIVEGMIVKSRFDGKDMTADSLTHLIQLVKDTDQMLDNAEQIEFEDATIRKGMLKWRFVNHEPNIDGALFDSPLEAYRTLRDGGGK